MAGFFLKGSWRRLVPGAACILAWAGLSVLGLWVLLQLRINLIDVVYIVHMSPWVIGMIDKFAIMGLGLLWLGLVVVLQGYLSSDVGMKRIGKRVRTILCIEIALLGFSYGLQALLR